MKELSFEKMEVLNGGDGVECGAAIIGLAISTAGVIASSGWSLLVAGAGYYSSLIGMGSCWYLLNY